MMKDMITSEQTMIAGFLASTREDIEHFIIVMGSFAIGIAEVSSASPRGFIIPFDTPVPSTNLRIISYPTRRFRQSEAKGR